MTSITLERIDGTASVTFEASGTSGWIFSGLKDWRGAPESKQEHPSRAGQSGSFRSTNSSRESMVPSFDVSYMGESESEALEAWDALAGLVAEGPETLMTVADALHTTSRLVDVRFATPHDHHGRTVITGSVDTFAPDPLRYGEAVTVSTGLPVSAGGLTWPITWPITWGAGGEDGRLRLPNTGKAPTFASFSVTGGLGAGFSLVEVGSGREIRFERLIPLGDTVYIDQRSGRAWINEPSNDLSTYLTRSDWFATGPGEESLVQFTAIGSSTGTPIATGAISPAFY